VHASICQLAVKTFLDNQRAASTSAMEVIQQCIAVYAYIKEQLNTIHANREAFRYLASRCDALPAPLDKLKADNAASINSKKGVLQNLLKVMKDIAEFMALERFHIDPKKW
jgi:hypothetical protein